MVAKRKQQSWGPLIMLKAVYHSQEERACATLQKAHQRSTDSGQEVKERGKSVSRNFPMCALWRNREMEQATLEKELGGFQVLTVKGVTSSSLVLCPFVIMAWIGVEKVEIQ